VNIAVANAIDNEKVGNNTFKIYNVDHAVCVLAKCDVAKKFVSGIEIENQLTVAWRGVDVVILEKKQVNIELIARGRQSKKKQDAEAQVVRQKQKTDEAAKILDNEIFKIKIQKVRFLF
ncbi:hypothetical protein Tco_1331312, partial [Tanacetum coccineum]